MRFADTPVDICVLTFCSGHSSEDDHYDLIARCLHSIIGNTDQSRYRLSIGCNNPSPRVLELVRTLGERDNTRWIIGEAARDGNDVPVYPKYPMMERLFADTRSPWLVWFDDDSCVTEPTWLDSLEDAINADTGAAQFGKQADVPLMNPDPGWMETAPWYSPSANCEKLDLDDGTQRVVCPYIVGGFYALRRDAMQKCRIPDPRLFHNHGDWTTGLALRHQGFTIKHHTQGVAINTEPRRGIHEDLWRAPGKAADLQQESIRRDRLLFERPRAPGGTGARFD